MTLNDRATAFIPATATIPSFSAYLTGTDATSLNIKEVDEPSSVDEIESTDNCPVDVYTLDGIRLRHHVKAAEATRGLQPGYYIIGTRKYRVL